MLIEHLSVSRGNLFKECKQEYKFKYHLKTKAPLDDHEYFDYGKIIHKIIEIYTKGNGDFKIFDIKKKVMSGELKVDTFKHPQQLTQPYKKRIDNNLNNFLKLNNRLGFHGEVEWDFHFDLDPPNKKHLKGVIDRLIIHKSQAFIVDYKTVQSQFHQKNINTIKDDLQLKCYALVVSKIFDIPPQNIKTALFYLESGDLSPVKFANQTLDLVQEGLIKLYDEIHNLKPENVIGNVGDHCRRCLYRPVCPFYRLT